MKVYLLISFPPDLDDQEIIGVFSTPERAMAERPGNWYVPADDPSPGILSNPPYDIQEWELDVPIQKVTLQGR